MGGPPEWWHVFEAASEINAPVWDVAALPETRGHHWWIEWALCRKTAIANAQAEQAEHRRMMRD